MNPTGTLDILALALGLLGVLAAQSSAVAPQDYLADRPAVTAVEAAFTTSNPGHRSHALRPLPALPE